MSKDEIKLADYSLAQELWNAISHGLGALFGVAALVLCILKMNNSSSTYTGLDYFAISFYCASIIICMTISCVYHSLAKNSGKKVLRVIDHSTIYFLIAGSYAPFSLILMKDVPLWGISNFPSAGIVIICLCYALIILGAVFTAINFEKFNLLSQLMYAIGGSIVLIDPVTFLKALSINTLGLVSFIVGSVLYFVGLAFYNVGKKKSLWWHTVFHFFILCGILGHFLSIYFSVII